MTASEWGDCPQLAIPTFDSREHLRVAASVGVMLFRGSTIGPLYLVARGVFVNPEELAGRLQFVHEPCSLVFERPRPWERFGTHRQVQCQM